MAAKDIKGLYSNNRRREINSVTCSLPYVLAPADLREGTAQSVVISADAYTALTIPAQSVIQSVYLIVEAGNEYGAASVVTVKVGATEVVASTTIAAAGITEGTNIPLLVDGSAEDIIITPTLAGTSTDKSEVKVLINYVDYDLGTVSFIGED